MEGGGGRVGGGVLLDEVHGGALAQRVAVLDLAEVAEEVVATVVWRNEAEALLAVPPLGRALGHTLGRRAGHAAAAATAAPAAAAAAASAPLLLGRAAGHLLGALLALAIVVLLNERYRGTLLRATSESNVTTGDVSDRW